MLKGSTPGLRELELPIPYGAHLTSRGAQFTIFSRHATAVWLLLFDEPKASKPSREIRLDPAKHRIGDVWHIVVPGVRAGQCYLYRMASDLNIPEAAFFNPDQWLLDPYAQAIAGEPAWGRASGLVPGQFLHNGPHFPKSVVVNHTFNWSGDTAPDIPLDQAVIYETHVRGYTVHPSAKTGNPGTYAGLIEKIPYLKKLGITSLELLPIHEFNEMEYFLENGARKNLRNFWGYSTRAFFAPMSRFAAAGICGEQIREFKKLVKACHKAGIEVILDVVFNHTDEGNENGPVWSMRGIDHSIYYMTEADRKKNCNYTGCGNTVNCNHPVVRKFILDCLRYWHLVMHVDGFRFDLASILTRGQSGEPLANPPVVEAIAEDPALRGAKLIAEAWDAAGLYQVGSFPNRHWSEWNGRYRDDIREFWNGSKHDLRTLATRFIGSPDLYAKNEQTPQKSINFIACHDGFTLNDIVCYNAKNNLENMESNRDGENHNRSFNYGVEGPTNDSAIRALRMRQMKNLLATLFLSQGVPMLLAGDEFARTQNGNNNAYCQDNPISWVDWSLLEKNKELFQFVRKLIAFRKTHPVLRKTRFLNDKLDSAKTPDVRWYGPENTPVDWDAGTSIACALLATEEKQAEDLFIIINADAKATPTYHFPERKSGDWSLALTTQDRPPAWRTGSKSIKVEPRSITVFRSSLL